MSTELVIGNFNDVLKATGQQSFDRSDSLARLKINTDATDDDENTLIPGSFELSPSDARKAYSKTASLRIFLRGFQYSRYNAKDEKSSVRSKIIKQWSEEAFDTSGGFKCGKVPRKEKDTLTPAQQLDQKDIVTHMYLFGTVTLPDAANAKGEAVEVVDQPCLMKVRGTNFFAISEYIDLLTAKKRDMIRTAINMTLKREKNGSVIYYVVQPSADFTAPFIWRGDVDLNLFHDFETYVSSVNAAVYEDFTKALSVKKAAGEAEEILGGVIKPSKKASRSLDDDFPNDDLKDLGMAG